jgi:hypothetical protein
MSSGNTTTAHVRLYVMLYPLPTFNDTPEPSCGVRLLRRSQPTGVFAVRAGSVAEAFRD